MPKVGVQRAHSRRWLLRAGRSVRVFEARPYLGGRIRSGEVPGGLVTPTWAPPGSGPGSNGSPAWCRPLSFGRKNRNVDAGVDGRCHQGRRRLCRQLGSGSVHHANTVGPSPRYDLFGAPHLEGAAALHRHAAAKRTVASQSAGKISASGVSLDSRRKTLIHPSKSFVALAPDGDGRRGGLAFGRRPLRTEHLLCDDRRRPSVRHAAAPEPQGRK